MMNYLDTLLTQNATIEEIEHLVEKLCNILPKQYKYEVSKQDVKLGSFLLVVSKMFISNIYDFGLVFLGAMIITSNSRCFIPPV